MMTFPEEILQSLKKSGVVAGFSVDKVEHAVPLAKALLAGCIDVIELTLRTPARMKAVKAESIACAGGTKPPPLKSSFPTIGG